MYKYNDIKVTFITTQGEVNFYLYPEAAPITVANFINLAKRGYYDDNMIHRAIENFVVQAGDPTGTGRGGPGYSIPDEIVEWLDFFQNGMLAMANAGPNTGGSQYFFSVYPAEWLNGKHTIFGEYIDDEDFNTIRKLEYGDVIKRIVFSDNADAFLALHKNYVDDWNRILDEEFPDLKKYPVRAATASEKAAYEAELKAIYADNKSKEAEYKLSPIPRLIKSVDNSFGSRKDKKASNDAKNAEEEAQKIEALKEDLDLIKAELDSQSK